MSIKRNPNCTPAVTPLAGVWIEIALLLSEEETEIVTPLAGVWIEMGAIYTSYRTCPVTPLAGVWIEMLGSGSRTTAAGSPPSRGCGSK